MKGSGVSVNWAARIIGGLGLVFFGMFIIGEGLPDLRETDNPQLKTMLLLMAFVAFAYLFAWFKPREGGMAITLAGVLLGMNMLFYGGMDDKVPALIFALPFIIPGVLFWWVGGKDRIGNSDL